MLFSKFKKYSSYVYCPYCDKLWPGWDVDLYKSHPEQKGPAIEFPGVCIKVFICFLQKTAQQIVQNKLLLQKEKMSSFVFMKIVFENLLIASLEFLNHYEIKTLVKALEEIPWEVSQSGRRKQNFGPKCNFKKKKLQLGPFNGFPKSTQFVQQKFSEDPILKTFQTVEQCTLEYNPIRGASIDPHIDDCWIWGERIVTVNVMGNSVLTMTPYHGPVTKYNLESVAEYSTVYKDLNFDKRNKTKSIEDIVVRLPMPEGSLMVLYGTARYKWEHCVLREDIKSRRICLAYRELTPPYLKNSSNNHEVRELLKRASVFQ
ncbi:PREDICTED: alpha-ketoglutarate-dependent dioxygenase alkB homolog 4 [Habropoda laboriosa]|uniref:alpha-ketoglutarate-dependent dioxygenase alkB homolog 4 n=1 Tax=Habropoda laboriosa TaxID=597456 RepID=UPI00083CA5EE|nr:PREDICTED: alpha-ketoglutarate-dependent dioxygenase alkB homolog 4 [Habropoda laboriosa]